MTKIGSLSYRIALWLLTRRLPAEWRDFVVGDLEEEFATRRERTASAAHAWLWWQTIRCLAAPPPVRRQSWGLERATGDSVMRTVWGDVRQACRTMRRTPGFAFAVVLVLGLGIGASTAIFSIVNAVLLRPLPFEEPERLVRIFTRTPAGVRFALSPAKFHDWERDARSFEGMAMYRFRQFAVSGTDGARTIEAGAVGAGFFDVVRARPALGRVFRPEEDSPAGKYVVVLSDRFWKSEFGGDPAVLGRTLRLSDEPYTIVGVMPPSASVASWGPMACDMWVPMALTDEQRAVRGNHNQRGVARLKAGVPLAQAQAEMDAISARLAREYPESDGRWGAAVVPMQEEIVGDSRAMLLMLLGSVGLVLLIACANVGNLLFTRALARRKEIAIRSALGAGRGRVFQQLLIEALLLASGGGALGFLLAHATLASTSTVLADLVPRATEISTDMRVLLFVLGISVLTGVLTGTLPALRAGRSDLNDALREGGRGEAAIGIRTRRLLIVAEVALSLVLLMGAGVMVQSLLALRYGSTGFDAGNVLTMNVRLPTTRYPTPSQRARFFDTALQRIRAVPGVDAAGTIDDLPLVDGSSQSLLLEGYPEPTERDEVAVQVRQITPGYLRAMRIPVLRGRDVAENDGEVLLVSESAAKLYWGDDDPIGRRASLALVSRDVRREVVGIVGDVKQRTLADAPTPTVYFYSQERYGSATFAIRTSLPPTSLVPSVAGVIRAVDPQQPIEDIMTMEQVIDRTLTSERFSAVLLGLFAATALLLASVGIYSVVSYIVRGRRREIGIRTALGARTGDVIRLIVAEGMVPTLIGVAVGTVGAIGSARLLDALVFGVSASDPVTLSLVGVTLVLVALSASVVPAYRASRFDPATVLRGDS